MPHPSLQRILKKGGIPNLIEVLSENLTPSDLQSLLLAVYEKQAAKVTPAQLKEQYQNNRFVKSSLLTPLELLTFDQFAFGIAKSLGFQGIELAPLSPLGSCSALGPVHQNKIVATSRNVEVISDPTNIMALECAIRREKYLKSNSKDKTAIHLCSSQRVTRAQFWDLPNFFAHFKLFTLCSAGSDKGNYIFEKESLEQHLQFYLELTDVKDTPYQFGEIEVLVKPIEERLTGFLENHLFPKLQQQFPSVIFKIDTERKKGIGYYETLCFTINTLDKTGATIHLTDGGFTDWTQQVVSNKKERYLISAIGAERLVSLFSKS